MMERNLHRIPRRGPLVPLRRASVQPGELIVVSGEAIRKTTCPGVAEFYNLAARPTKYEVKLLPEVEPLSVTLSRDNCGVIGVECPFYGKWRVCTRVDRLPYTPGMNVIYPTCRYALAAMHESSQVYTPAFEPPDFYLKVWNRLSPEAKTACIEMSPYALGGIGESAFRGMCLAFYICNDLEKANQIIEEVAEMGVVKEMGWTEALQAGLEQIRDGKVEDIEVKAGGRDAEEAAISGIRSALYYRGDLLRKYEYTLRRHGGNSEHAPVLRQVKEELEERWLKFSPGFQSFVDQFYNSSGFPIDFTVDLNGEKLQNATSGKV